jgi:hypothetical protein
MSAAGGGAAADEIEPRLAAERAAIAELRSRVSELESTVEAQREAVLAKVAAKAEQSEVTSRTAEADAMQSYLDQARAAVEAAEAKMAQAEVDGTAAPTAGTRHSPAAHSAPASPAVVSSGAAGVAGGGLDESILPALLGELEPLFAANETNFALCWSGVRSEVEAAWREAWVQQGEELNKLVKTVGATEEVRGEEGGVMPLRGAAGGGAEQARQDSGGHRRGEGAAGRGFGRG